MYITDAAKEYSKKHAKDALPETKGDAYERYDCLDIYDIHEAYYGYEPRGFEYEDMDDDDIAFEKEFMIGELFNSGEIDKLEKLLPTKDSCSKDALKSAKEATIDIINDALNLLDDEYDSYSVSDKRYPGYTDILVDMHKAIEILEKYKRQ